jgi:hypothetical protein
MICMDVCPVNSDDKSSLDCGSSLKLFQTSAIDIIIDCYAMFDLKRISEPILQIKKRFLLKYIDEYSNLFCVLLPDFALLGFTCL